MYLSQLTLNQRSPQLRKELNDYYELHRTLMRAFPNHDQGGCGHVLFRIDLDTASNLPMLLVQSDKRPNWDQPPFVHQYVLQNPQCKEVEPHFQSEMVLRFRLRANPTRKDPKTGKRYAHLTTEKQLEWLQRKLSQCGASLYDHINIPEGWRQSKGSSVKHYAVRFEGTLRIIHPSKFKETWEQGIGPAKAFGFGLLSIAKA